MSPDTTAQSRQPSRAKDFYFISLYLAASFLFTWSFWYLAWLYTTKAIADLPLIPILIVGSFGPFLAVALCMWIDSGFAGTLRYYARVFNLRMGWPVFLLSFFLIPALAVAAAGLHAWLNHTALIFQMTWADFPMAYLWLLFLGGAVAEEFGWTYLSDKLDRFLPATLSTLVLGAIWACWHLPLFFIIAPGLVQYYTPFYMFFVGVVAMRFMFSWAYHKGKHNVLSNILFHNASNLGYSIVVLAPTPDDPSIDTYLFFTILTIFCASLLWLRFPLRQQDMEEPVPPAAVSR